MKWLNGFKKKHTEETHFCFKDTDILRMKGWRMLFQATGNQRKSGVTVLISDKIEFKLKMVKRDKEGYNDKEINPSRRYNNHK